MARLDGVDAAVDLLDSVLRTVSILDGKIESSQLAESPFKQMFGLRMAATPQEDYPIRFHRDISDSNNFYRTMAMGFELFATLVSDIDKAAFNDCLEKKEYYINRDVEANQRRDQNPYTLPNKFAIVERDSHPQQSPDAQNPEVFSKRPTSALSQASGATRMTQSNNDLDISQEDIVFKKYV